MSERNTVTGRRSRFFNYLIKRSDGRPMLKEDRTVILDLLWDEAARKACLMYAFEIWDSDRDYAVSILNSIADAEISTTPSELLSGLRKRPQEPTGESTGVDKGEGEKAPQRPESSAGAPEIKGMHPPDQCLCIPVSDKSNLMQINRKCMIHGESATKEVEILGQKLGDAAMELGDGIGRAHSPETETLARKVGVSPQAVEDAADVARRLGRITGHTADECAQASSAIKDAMRQDSICTCRDARKDSACPVHGDERQGKPFAERLKMVCDSCKYDDWDAAIQPCKSCMKSLDSSWEAKVDGGS